MADTPQNTKMPAAPSSVQAWANELSEDILIAMTFGKSPSGSYPEALYMAQQADIYKEATIHGRPLHLAAFRKTASGANRASALLGLIGNWKSTHVVAGNRNIVNTWSAIQTAQCYADSFSCADTSAHCLFHNTIHDYQLTFHQRDLAEEILPCRRLNGWAFQIAESHPSTRADQIQAIAVKEGCDWCPNFNKENYRYFPAGSKKKPSQSHEEEPPKDFGNKDLSSEVNELLAMALKPIRRLLGPK